MQLIACGKKYSHSSKRWAEVTYAVTYSIGKDKMPMYSVEKEDFQCLVTTLDSKYELPVANTFPKQPYHACTWIHEMLQ